MNQLEQNVFNVFTDITCFGEGRCISNREGDVEALGQGLSEVGLSTAGGANEQNVGLLDFHIIVLAAHVSFGTHSLVVVVDGNRE